MKNLFDKIRTAFQPEQVPPEKRGKLEDTISTAILSAKQIDEQFATETLMQYPKAFIRDLYGYLRQALANSYMSLNILTYDIILDPKFSDKFPITELELPGHQNQNPDELASWHAKLLLGAFGVEGINITNGLSTLLGDSEGGFSKGIGKVASQLRLRQYQPAQSVIKYLSDLCGQDVSALVPDLAKIPPNDIVNLEGINRLLPNELGLQGAIIGVLAHGLTYGEPFQSPCFIVMETQPPDYRPFIANTLFNGYAKTGAPSFLPLPSKALSVKSPELTGLAKAVSEFHESIWYNEAQRAGIKDVAPYRRAHDQAMENFRYRFNIRDAPSQAEVVKKEV